ncbi:hypothetical protein EVAR_56244_1 [Eumeta japonica]|uniref:Uncharacterized protein n=1 Tax=Eumeta variegata TaxID=151549 RepID=A0A4C1XFT2_EUMVA|nr:hypothetical protein EVAR_56244_1 [Eumeta japonica]
MRKTRKSVDQDSVHEVSGIRERNVNSRGQNNLIPQFYPQKALIQFRPEKQFLTCIEPTLVRGPNADQTLRTLKIFRIEENISTQRVSEQTRKTVFTFVTSRTPPTDGTHGHPGDNKSLLFFFCRRFETVPRKNGRISPRFQFDIDNFVPWKKRKTTNNVGETMPFRSHVLNIDCHNYKAPLVERVILLSRERQWLIGFENAAYESVSTGFDPDRERIDRFLIAIDQFLSQIKPLAPSFGEHVKLLASGSFLYRASVKASSSKRQR